MLQTVLRRRSIRGARAFALALIVALLVALSAVSAYAIGTLASQTHAPHATGGGGDAQLEP